MPDVPTADTEDRILISDTRVYDTAGNFEKGTLTVTPVKAGLYLLTVGASVDFLTDENTVYPVYFDPSLTISYGTTGSGYIEDVTVFEGIPNINCGTFLYSTVGYSEDYGRGRTAVRLNGLYNSSIYQTIIDSQITSVKFHVKEASGTDPQNILLYPLESKTWTESGATWNNIGAHSDVSVAEATLENNGLASFDITNLVSWDWKGNAANAQPARDFYQEQGFLMVSSDETAVKQICSSEYTTTSYRPYVVMEYTAVIEIAGNSAIYLGTGDTRQLSYNTYPSDLEVSVTWSSDTPAVASVSSTGLVTGLSQGVAMISISATSAAGAVITSGKLRVYVEDPFMDYQPWFIKGKNTKQFIGKSEESTNLADPIISGELIDDFFPQWKIQYIPDYNYHLIVYDGYYFGVKPVSGSDVLSVGLYNSFSVTECRWTIVPTGAETYKIYSQYSSQIDYYLCLKDGELILGTDETEGVDISEWTIQEKIGASVLFFDNVTVNPQNYSRYSSIEKKLKEIGDTYTNLVKNKSDHYLSKEQLRKRIEFSEIGILIGHGTAQKHLLLDDSVSPANTLSAAEINQWHFNLSKCSLVFVGACGLGKVDENGDCIAQSFVNKGVDTAIGFNEAVTFDNLTTIINAFVDELVNVWHTDNVSYEDIKAKLAERYRGDWDTRIYKDVTQNMRAFEEISS